MQNPTSHDPGAGGGPAGGNSGGGGSDRGGGELYLELLTRRDLLRSRDDESMPTNI